MSVKYIGLLTTAHTTLKDTTGTVVWTRHTAVPADRTPLRCRPLKMIQGVHSSAGNPIHWPVVEARCHLSAKAPFHSARRRRLQR